MQHATTINAINLFQNDIFNTFGVPPFLHSDNGRQFISKELKELLSLYGIQHKTTGFYKYSQQANASERTNREIISKLRFFLKNESEHLIGINLFLTFFPSLEVITTALLTAPHITPCLGKT